MTTQSESGSNSAPSTHSAIVTVGASQPLQVHRVTTPIPQDDQVKVLVQYTTTSPLDMHQALGGLLVTPPQILGSSVAGVVVQIGPSVKMLKVGDRVFGYMFRGDQEKTYQVYVVASERQFARVEDTSSVMGFRRQIADVADVAGGNEQGHDNGSGNSTEGEGAVGSSGQRSANEGNAGKEADVEDGRVQHFTMEECVSIANNFVSAWHAITADLGLELPWPKPPWFHRQHDIKPQPVSILIWGGGSSVGQYALQILSWYGYKDITVVASNSHHEKLKKYGAARCISYSEGDIVKTLNEVQQTTKSQQFSHILDCIGSLEGSIEPISRIAKSPSRVAIFLPVIVRDATVDASPKYSLDVQDLTAWTEGVDAVGIRTHFYTKNEYLADHLQNRIMPAALSLGIVEPNERILVEGKTMLERAEKALQLLRDKQVRGSKLVWRVAEDSEIDRVLRSLKAQ